MTTIMTIEIKGYDQFFKDSHIIHWRKKADLAVKGITVFLSDEQYIFPKEVILKEQIENVVRLLEITSVNKYVISFETAILVEKWYYYALEKGLNRC